MRNLARLTHAAGKQVERCKGKPCLRCGKPAVAAIGSWAGWFPACSACAEKGKRIGYEVVYFEGEK